MERIQSLIQWLILIKVEKYNEIGSGGIAKGWQPFGRTELQNFEAQLCCSSCCYIMGLPSRCATGNGETSVIIIN